MKDIKNISDLTPDERNANRGSDRGAKMLDASVGEEEAARIVDKVENGEEDAIFEATMSGASYWKLKYLDGLKHGTNIDSKIPKYVVGDSKDVYQLAGDGRFDFIFSCPPYGDLEVYSDDARDLSNMDFEMFKRVYQNIIDQTCQKLNDNRFAAFVVSDFRDKKGMYRDFVSYTIECFRDAGLELYNEAIFVHQSPSLPMRVGRPFVGSRKLGKAHQNVLIFVKGDPVEATKAIGDINVSEDEVLEMAMEWENSGVPSTDEA